MIHRWRLLSAATWVAFIVVVATVAVNVSGGGAAATVRAGTVVAQPASSGPPATTRVADRWLPPSTDATTTTTTPATTVAPTTVAPTTTAPRPAPTTAAPAPRVTAAPVIRPAVTTQPPAAPAPVARSGGSASDFSLLGYRWNPCQVITVSSSGPDISGIVAELASITGLHLQVVGGLAEITVGYGAVPPGGEIGLTAWRAVGAWLNLVGITISSAAGPYLATVLRHELGHALGLGHAARPDEVMYPLVSASSPKDFQAGDLAGLRAISPATRC
jgi:hypothetical protein